MSKEGGNKPVRGILFVLSRLAIVVVIIMIVIVAFYAAMNTMNIDMIAKDALVMRAKVVLVHDEEKVDSSSLKNFFTEDFLNSDPVLTSSTYDGYKVTNFYQRVNVHPPIVWPWQDKVSVEVDDIITDIAGREADQTDEEGNTIKGTAKPPEWKNGSYQLEMVKVEDAWKIDSMEFIKAAALPTVSPSPEASSSQTVSPTPEGATDTATPEDAVAE